MRTVWGGIGWQATQVGPQVFQVGVAEFGEGRIGEGREVVRAVRSQAQTHGADEILFAPATQPGLGMRREVGAVEGAKRCLEGAATGVGHALLTAVFSLGCVASHTATGTR